ncbi:YbaB/EbfC family nucleoid-associated protein [Amycolatopsis saalfeldensis]|uniref:YbaB/EbfC DNA-binding family protein n=1 Tax=Amycolatopsis saalfeldensis TaxID=394193 RepID=A0A1H8U2K3_9PSEU|nr:YbaB/EbfC family nucleoid-associated protein [Amycolatopsis saalfeldensis]SEO97502.1 YbaB/EbfC DNA-binding family protein [Amycolatopsis saalfeldensis]
MTQFAQGGDGDPLASFTAEVEDIRAKAEEMSERLRTATGTARTPDGAVSVTVGAAGVLQGITFGAKAYHRPPEALSATVMQLIATAQKQVSAEVYGAFGGLVGGPDSEAMSILQEFLPQPDEEEDEPAPPAPAPPPPPPPHQPPPPPAAASPRQQESPPSASPRRPPRSAPVEDDLDNNPW